MSQEESYEPTKEKINKAVSDVGKQMDDYFKSKQSSQPSTEEVEAVLRGVAEKSGGSYESYDPEIATEEIINRYEKEGWSLVDIFVNATDIKAGEDEDEEKKIIGLGKVFLVFKRKKQEV